LKKLLVIGGNGFVGRHLIQNLDKDLFEAFALVRSFPELPLQGCRYLQMNDLLSRRNLKFDIIINVSMLRSTSPPNENSIFESNYLVPIEVIKQHSFSETVVINTSTYIQHYLGIPDNPVEVYGIAKSKLSNDLEALAQKGEFILKDLYLFTLFGENDRADRFLPNLIKRIRNRSDLYLTGGEQLLNLLNISDLVPILLAEANTKTSSYERFRLWDDQYLKLSELVLQLVGDREMNVYFGQKKYNGHEMFEPWPFILDVHPGLGKFENPITTLRGYVEEV
jgi:nucleoside-diphosphate-sugar epimerase